MSDNCVRCKRSLTDGLGAVNALDGRVCIICLREKQESNLRGLGIERMGSSTLESSCREILKQLTRIADALEGRDDILKNIAITLKKMAHPPIVMDGSTKSEIERSCVEKGYAWWGTKPNPDDHNTEGGGI